MGREASCEARVGGQSGLVKALLESRELILRGAIARRYDTALLRQPQVQGDWLHLQAGGEAVALALGAAEAASWLKKLQTPPPTLAQKLGIDAAQPAWVIGSVDDAAVAEALVGATTEEATAARFTIALVRSAEALQAARQAHEGLPHSRHLWVLHPKGRDSTLPDSMVREQLRAAGYKDSKTTAVSAQWAATRYARA